MTRWSLRPATTADADVIGEITVAGWRYAYAGIVPADRLAAMDPIEVAERRREQIAAPPPRFTVVAEDATGVRGYVMVGAVLDPERDGHPDLPTGALNSLYLDPEVIGTGAGGALHDAGLAHLVDAGFRWATLWIFTGNERAAAFYERRGWHADGEPTQPDEWSAPGTRYARPLP